MGCRWCCNDARKINRSWTKSTLLDVEVPDVGFDLIAWIRKDDMLLGHLEETILDVLGLEDALPAMN